MKRRFTCLLLLLIQTTLLAQQDYLITDYGARGDGITLNTHAIQRAIDDAAAAGGGRVVVPAGNYVTGSLYLRSGVHLHLAPRATLLGSLNPFDYVKDSVCHWTALLFAIRQQDITIDGSGTIDGRGWQVANNLVQYIHLGLVDDPLRYDRPNETLRPENIHFFECTNLTIKEITMRNPASWNQQYDRCRNLLIDGITVDAKAYWNNDGLDVVDCQDVIIRNCYIDAADDAYCFKSHSRDGVCERVLMEHCVGRSSANGIKFGTVTRGTFRHFTIRNNKIFDTYRSALTIASVDGAVIEDILVDSLQSINTGNPFFIRLANRNTGDTKPQLRNIRISHLYAEVPGDKPDAGYRYEGPVEDLPRNCSPSSIVGVPGLRIQQVVLQDITLRYPGRADSSYAYCGTSPQQLAAIAEREQQYPEFSMWKELPAWGLYIRHADSIQFDNVRISVGDHDYRPAVVLDDVTHADLAGLTITATDDTILPLVANGCADINHYQGAIQSQRAVTTTPTIVTPTTNSSTTPIYNASRFGIKSDGLTDNTASIQRALDYIGRQGGGTLHFQVGRYRSGSILLRPGVNIQLDEGAILVGSTNRYDYREGCLLLTDPIANLGQTQPDTITISGLGIIEIPTLTDDNGTPLTAIQHTSHRPSSLRVVLSGISIKTTKERQQH